MDLSLEVRMIGITTDGSRRDTNPGSRRGALSGRRRRGAGSARAARIVFLLALGACDGDRPPVGPEPHATRDASFAASDVRFVEDAALPFGTFGELEYVRHVGRFVGRSSLGEFRMPYEIIAPIRPELGNGTVLVEPPHFGFGPAGRDFVLGRELLFGRGFSYAAVGFGDNLLNVLDPTASDLVLAGAPVVNPTGFDPFGILDEEIIVQFAEAITTEPFAVEILGQVDRRYAYGISQTAAVMLELQRNVAGTDRQDQFDLTLLHVALWHPPFFEDDQFDFLDGEFEPLEGVGRVLFVESEGDQVISDAEHFRRAIGVPGYRVYEVAGAAHQPTPDNPLDHLAVARALFVAGDAWVRTGVEPPPSAILEAAPAGQIDPVHGFETGIARNGDLNALGGVRLPDLAVGRAQFIASDPATLGPGLPPVFAILSGSMVDLACEPAWGSPTDDESRFRNHGAYVRTYVRHADELRLQGFLLPADANALKARAAESEVGKPGTCVGLTLPPRARGS